MIIRIDLTGTSDICSGSESIRSTGTYIGAIMFDFIIQFSVAIGLVLILVFLLWPAEQSETSASGSERP